jgi:hypothetical protein
MYMLRRSSASTGHETRVGSFVVPTFRIPIPAIADGDPHRHDNREKCAGSTDYLTPRRENIGIDAPEEPHLGGRLPRNDHATNTAGTATGSQSVEQPNTRATIRYRAERARLVAISKALLHDGRK